MTGAKSDDIHKRNSLQTSLLFSRKKTRTGEEGAISNQQVDLRSNQSESFNLLLQHLRGIGFDLRATDHQGNEIDFYEAFSRKSPKK